MRTSISADRSVCFVRLLSCRAGGSFCFLLHLDKEASDSNTAYFVVIVIVISGVSFMVFVTDSRELFYQPYLFRIIAIIGTVHATCYGCQFAHRLMIL